MEDQHICKCGSPMGDAGPIGLYCLNRKCPEEDNLIRAWRRHWELSNQIRSAERSVIAAAKKWFKDGSDIQASYDLANAVEFLESLEQGNGE